MLQRLLFLALVAGVAAQAPRNCSFSTLTTCSKTFNQNLNITEAVPWADSFNYRVMIEALYQNDGISGVRKVCRYFREMKACMGECYQQLLSVPSLVKDGGVDTIHAYVYMSTYNSLHYLCGAGFNTAYVNKVCWMKTWKDNAGSLDEARRRFETTAYNNPKQACGLTGELLRTFERAFSSGCGVNARDTTFFGCEYARTSIVTMFPQCSGGCSLPVVG